MDEVAANLPYLVSLLFYKPDKPERDPKKIIIHRRERRERKWFFYKMFFSVISTISVVILFCQKMVEYQG